MAFHTYLVRCADGSYYCGHTESLDHRIADHNAGRFRGYTYRRRPVSLVWTADFPSRYEALSAERQIKGWSLAKKEALIDGDWILVSLLARNRQGR